LPSGTLDVLCNISVLYEREERSMGLTNSAVAAVSWLNIQPVLPLRLNDDWNVPE
jgi:hypothetical protein